MAELSAEQLIQAAVDAAPPLNADTIDQLRLILAPAHRIAAVVPMPARPAERIDQRRAA